MRLPSRAAALLAAAALPFALAACSSGSSGSSGSTGSTPDATASAKPAKKKDPNAGLLTGEQLKAALVPASSFPTGYTPLKDGSADTGKDFQAQEVKAMGSPDCTRLGATAWIATTAISGVSFAQNGYGTKTEEMDQEIDEFRGTAAQQVMERIRSLATTCATYLVPDDHTKVTVKGHTLTGIGDEAFSMTLTNRAFSGDTLVAVREGTAVITVLSSRGPDDGVSSAKKLAKEAAASLKNAVAKAQKETA
ncbi:hypothetical protein ACL02U_25230 [Streptomyces sp. MS06]|uniref:hypothetical protein n=1 Tax=Streptomyces sp. MS06 TaxID=3385974 RepID=UPI0039A298C8